MVYEHNATRLGVYNVGGGGGLTGGDDRVREILGWFRDALPDAAFLAEAYDENVAGSGKRMEHFAEDLALLGYKVGWAVYNEPDARESRVGFLAATKQDLTVARPADQAPERVKGDAGFFEMVRFAGYGAVEMSLNDRYSGRELLATGNHFSTFERPRQRQLAEYLKRHAIHMKEGQPLALLADVNSVSYQNLFTLGLRGAGVMAELGYEMGVLPKADIDGAGLSRIMSLVERAAEYSSARESRLLQEKDFRNAAPGRTPTASLPETPPQLSRLIAAIPLLGAWLLRAPHLGIDQIRLFPSEQWVVEESRVYPQQGPDDHTPVLAAVRLLQGYVSSGRECT